MYYKDLGETIGKLRRCGQLKIIIKEGEMGMRLTLNSLFLLFDTRSVQNIPPLTNAAKMIQEPEESEKSLLEVSAHVMVPTGKTLIFPREQLYLLYYHKVFLS